MKPAIRDLQGFQSPVLVVDFADKMILQQPDHHPLGYLKRKPGLCGHVIGCQPSGFCSSEQLPHAFDLSRGLKGSILRSISAE